MTINTVKRYCRICEAKTKHEVESNDYGNEEFSECIDCGEQTYSN